MEREDLDDSELQGELDEEQHSEGEQGDAGDEQHDSSDDISGTLGGDGHVSSSLHEESEEEHSSETIEEEMAGGGMYIGVKLDYGGDAKLH